MRRFFGARAAAIGLAVTLACGGGIVPTISGRVVDLQTQEAVSSATVFAAYSRSEVLAWHRGHPVHSLWATTGPDGRFEISSQLRLDLVSPFHSNQPILIVFHPEYGVVNPFASLPNEEAHRLAGRFPDDLLRAIRPARSWFRPSDLKKTDAVLWTCSLHYLTSDACDVLCELTVGIGACRSLRAQRPEWLPPDYWLPPNQALQRTGPRGAPAERGSILASVFWGFPLVVSGPGR